ncbi:MAG: hypothetical protein QXO12_01475 [Candidatus Pacearchaeota archaeon]
MKKLLNYLLLLTFLFFSRDFCINNENHKNIGINLAYYQNRKFNQEDKEFIKYLANIGIKNVAIHWTFYQDSLNSNYIYAHKYKTMNFEFVDSLIKELRKYNMKIILKPAIDILTEESRTKIMPKSIDEWFKNYENLIIELAKYAEKNKIEIFSVGVELDEIVKHHREKFYDLVKKIRKFYSGKIIYCANIIRKKDLENFLIFDIPAIDAYFKNNDYDSLRFYFSILPCSTIITEFGFKDNQEKKFKNFIKALRSSKKIKEAYIWNTGEFKVIDKNKNLIKF